VTARGLDLAAWRNGAKYNQAWIADFDEQSSLIFAPFKPTLPI
jgi:hypothetical protein